jgi:outer membrane protein assembly factor BamB
VAVAEQNGGGPGFLQGIDANTGARLWTSTVPVSQAGQSCSDPIAIPFPHFPAAIEVGTFDGTLMSFDSLAGSLVWQRQITGGASIIAKPHWVPFVHF